MELTGKNIKYYQTLLTLESMIYEKERERLKKTHERDPQLELLYELYYKLQEAMLDEIQMRLL